MSSPASRTRPAKLPAVEVRNEARRRAQQRGLAAAGEAGEQAELARRDLQRDVAERGALDAGVAIGDALEAEHRVAHRSIPRRSQKGSSAAAASAAAKREHARVERHLDERIGGERGDARQPPGDREREDRRGRRREGDVVARQRSARDRRPPAAFAVRAGEAAHLERRRDVHRAVQRAGDDGAQQRHAPARARRRASRTRALRLGQALGVGGEHGDHARGERHRERRAKRQSAEHAQQLVGVYGEAGERR